MPSGSWDRLCVPPTPSPTALTPFLARPHPPASSPHCGPAHTWPSQIRALENQRAERKAGCMVERGEGRGGCLVDRVFQHSDGAKS